MHGIDFSKGSHRCHIFNQHAMAFVPLNKLDNHGDVITIITAFLMTIFLFLLPLFRSLISNNKGDHDEDINPKETLRTTKNDNPYKIIIGHIHFNSIRLKFEFLKKLIVKNIDIFLISETKLDETFPPGQFLINGYQSPLRFDRNENGGGLLLFFRDQIPFKTITLHFNQAFEAIAIEINLKKRN